MTIALFLLAFVIRLIACITPAIWYDEAYSLNVAALPIAKIIAIRDFTPPLWEIILHPFVTLAPHVITLRIIALVFSMLAMYAAYLITRELKFTPAQTNLSMLIIAAMPGITWMSSDGRSYSMLACFTIAGALCVIRKNNIALFIVSTLMLYTHVTSVFYIAALFIIAYMRGEKLAKLMPLGAGLFLAWLPWMFVMVSIVTNPAGVTPYEPLTLKYFIGELAAAFWIGSSAWLYLFGFLLMLITIAAKVKPFAMALAPVLVMAIISLLGFTLITYRTISPSIIPFALLIGFTYGDTPLSRVWILIIALSAITYQFDAKGSTQKQAAEIILEKPAPVVYSTLTVALPFEYYLPTADSCLLLLQPDGALINPTYDFGLQRCTPEELTAPYWFITPEEPKIPPAASDQMQAIAAKGTLGHHMQYLQISPVNVYWIGE